MYLSRLLINPRDQQARHDLADCQALHARLLSAFPHIEDQGDDARAQFGLLYRIDENAKGQIQVLAQSSDMPNWSSLPPGYLLMTGDTENPACKAVDGFYESLAAGTVLRFRLRANPTKKIDTKSGPDGVRRNGKRIELRSEEQWLAWLQRKSEQHGFALNTSGMDSQRLNAQATDQGKMLGKRNGTEGRGRITLASVLFNGVLAITDAERFRKALRQGIGSGKAYGFGLLSVARTS